MGQSDEACWWHSAIICWRYLGYAIWWRRKPSACPYAQRFWLELPHPIITRAHLREALTPEPGERVLEIGPGAGYYALEVAVHEKGGTTRKVRTAARPDRYRHDPRL